MKRKYLEYGALTFFVLHCAKYVWLHTLPDALDLMIYITVLYIINDNKY